MDPRLQKYGDYRRLAQAPTVTYLIAHVDNRSEGVINMYQVVVVTAEGRQVEATSVSDYVDRWRDAISEKGGDWTAVNRGYQLANDSTFYLHPGAKGTAILATDVPIKSVKRVFVYPAGGFDRLEAFRAS